MGEPNTRLAAQPAGGRRSLRATLLWMLLVPAIPLLILCTAAVWYQWRADVALVHENLADSANAIAFALDRETARSRAILETLAASDLIDAKDWRAFHKLASAALSREPDTFIALTEPGGAQPVRTVLPYGSSPTVNPFELGTQAPDIEWNGTRLPLSSQGLAKRVIDSGKMSNSGLYYGLSIKRPVVSIAIPVMRKDQTVYVLIMGYPVDRLVSLIADASHPQARISVIDVDGRIVARSRNPSGGVGVTVSPALQAAIKNNDHGMREGHNLAGEDSVAAFRRMQLVDWTVYASMPQAVAYERSRGTLMIWALIGALFTAASFIGARRLWRKVAPPLIALGSSASALQRGDAPQLPRSGIYEIEELSRLMVEAAATEKRESEQTVRRVAAEQSERATRELMGALSLSENRFRTLFEQSGIGIVAIDLHTLRFVLANERMSEITGYTQEQLLQLTFSDITHPSDLRQDLAAMRALACGERACCETEKRYIRKDGAVRWVEVHVRRFPSGSDGLTLSFASVIDITARKEAELALKQADQRKDEFLATLAHELRNPLAPIRNGLEIIRQRAGDVKAVLEVRSMMERQVSHIVRLVDDLLDVSRISTGRIQLRRKTVDVRDIVRAAAEGWRPALEANKHQVCVTLDNEPVVVDGDAARLLQIIDNLVDNAVKYSDRPGSIALSAVRRGEHAVISVTDTGIGIPGPNLHQIFELFSQLKSAPHSGTNRGLGIGLHLVKRLAELHGGNVKADSKGAGRGSEFVVSLPLLHVDIPAPGKERRIEPASAMMRILVVDDNEDAATSMAALIEMWGHDVATALSGGEALIKAAAWRPVLVLLDLGMPVMDGYEVARRLRQLAGLQALSIVAVSGWGQAEDRQKTAAAGFNHHLVKPVDPQHLERIIARVSRLHAEPQEA